MLQRVQSYIQEHRLLQQDSPVIVAISGGADSVALWHILKTLGYDCIMAHCNFHLRGSESDRDEQFVRQLAEANDTPLHTIDFDTIAHAESHHLSIEMSARELRYEWFYQLCGQLHAQAIAVAHHADDNIETLLMNLLRGSGLRGMTGIPRRNDQVVRPLLCCSRQEIEDYLSEHGLPFVTDSTNRSLDYTRNKLRNVVLPMLEEINPAVRQTLYADIERFNEAYTIYRQAVDDINAGIVSHTATDTRIDIQALRKQPAYRTLLYELLQAYGFSPAVIAQVADSLDSEPGKRFHAPAYQLLKDRDCFIIQPTQQQPDCESYLIDQSTTGISTPFDIQCRTFPKGEGFRPSRSKDKIHVDLSKITFPLTLRHWQEGDIFQPFGMKGKKKVSDYFIDNKLSLFEKEQCWLLLSGNEIVWIVGHRTDDRFKITDRTTEVLELVLNM